MFVMDLLIYVCNTMDSQLNFYYVFKVKAYLTVYFLCLRDLLSDVDTVYNSTKVHVKQSCMF